MSEIDLYSYNSFRTYLKDWLDYKLNEKHRLSFRNLAKRFGFGAPNSLQRIVSGNTNISEFTIRKLVDGIGLNAKKEEYFRLLVSFEQTQCENEKSRLQEKIEASVRQRRIEVLAKKDYPEFRLHWYFSAVWELAFVKGFDLTPENISEAFCDRINVEQAAEALDHLLKFGFLALTETPHRYLQTKEYIGSSDDQPSKQLKGEHLAYADLGAVSLELPVEMREFQGLTIALSDRNLSKAKQLIKAFAIQLATELSGDEQADKVYRVNLQVFPVTKNMSSEVGSVTN